MPKSVSKRTVPLQRSAKSGVRSPCISVCTYDNKSKYCTGCFRDLKDIQNWWEMSEAEKKEALKRCKENRRKSSGK